MLAFSRNTRTVCTAGRLLFYRLKSWSVQPHIEIKVVEDKLSDWHLLKEPWYQFFLNEPLCSMITAFRDPSNKEFICQILYENFKSDPESPCIMAWDKDKKKAVGLIECRSIYRESPAESCKVAMSPWYDHTWDNHTISKVKAYNEFFDMMINKANVTDRFGIDKALLIDNVSICPEYERRGIANAMISKSLQVARERGYPLVLGEITSAVLQAFAIRSFGFEPLLEFDLRENYRDYAEMPEEVQKTHTSAMVLIKKLA